MWIGEEHHVLAAGDSISFDSGVPHRVANVGDSTAVVVPAITPPHFCMEESTVEILVLFRLKPGVTPADYEDDFAPRRTGHARRSISSYRVWRVAGVMEGEPTFEFLEEMELADRGAFEQEIEAVPEMAAMLESWYEESPTR